MTWRPPLIAAAIATVFFPGWPAIFLVCLLISISVKAFGDAVERAQRAQEAPPPWRYRHTPMTEENWYP